MAPLGHRCPWLSPSAWGTAGSAGRHSGALAGHSNTGPVGEAERAGRCQQTAWVHPGFPWDATTDAQEGTGVGQLTSLMGSAPPPLPCL